LTKGRHEAVEARIKCVNGVVVAYTAAWGDGDKAEASKYIEGGRKGIRRDGARERSSTYFASCSHFPKNLFDT
jgi:hypothetical protein